jgi:hypothetical protein
MDSSPTDDSGPDFLHEAVTPADAARVHGRHVATIAAFPGVITLVAAIVGFWTSYDRLVEHLAMGMFSVTPWALIVFGSLRPRAFALGFAHTVAWLAILASTVLALLLLLAAAFASDRIAGAFILVVGWSIVLWLSWRMATAASRARAALPSATRGAWIMGKLAPYAYLVVGFPLFLMATSHAAYRIELAADARERVVREQLIAIHACVQRHAQAHPSVGFPTSLEVLGPHGTGCLDERSASGHAGAWPVRLTPGSVDANGAVRQYVLRAGPDVAKGGKARFYSDESTLIRHALDTDRDADSSLFPERALTRRLRDLQACIESYRRELGMPEIPSLRLVGQYRDTLLRRPRVGNGECGRGAWSGWKVVPGSEDELADSTYRVRLERLMVTGQPAYSLIVSPVDYGRTAIRGYYADPDGRVYVTMENREATPRNRPLEHCSIDQTEFDWLTTNKREECWRGVSAPPVATLKVDTMIAKGDSFRMALSGATDSVADNQRAGFRYVFGCWGYASEAFTTDSSVLCRPPYGDSAVVVAKVMNRDRMTREYRAVVHTRVRAAQHPR